MIKTILTSRILHLLIAITVLSAASLQLYKTGKFNTDRVEAAGNLTFTYLGIPLGDPVFEVYNMMPGDCQTRTIHAQNSGSMTAKVAVKGIKKLEVGNLSTQLSLIISENGNDLYGGTATSGAKLVSDFFVDSAPTGELKLSNIATNAETDYDFEVCFNQDAGNEFQEAKVVFDLKFQEIKVPIELPSECSHLEGTITKVIIGTAGKDKINGTNASELIIGLGGNDEIDGKSGHDCIVGGDGDDELDGGSGDDTIIGGPGKDKIDGGSGKDKLYGGLDNDKIDGGSEEDLIYGNEGDDVIDGGSHSDTIYGGPGKDKITGGSHNDKLYGESGNDTISGGSGNDLLDGGPDTDKLDGDSGTDTCLNGENLTSCEL